MAVEFILMWSQISLRNRFAEWPRFGTRITLAVDCSTLVSAPGYYEPGRVKDRTNDQRRVDINRTWDSKNHTHGVKIEFGVGTRTGKIHWLAGGFFAGKEHSHDLSYFRKNGLENELNEGEACFADKIYKPSPRFVCSDRGDTRRFADVFCMEYNRAVSSWEANCEVRHQAIQAVWRRWE